MQCPDNPSGGGHSEHFYSSEKCYYCGITEEEALEEIRIRNIEINEERDEDDRELLEEETLNDEG